MFAKRLYTMPVNIDTVILSKLIEEKGYTRSEFAKLIGVSKSTMSNILTKTYSPSLELSMKITFYLGVPFDTVFSYIPEK
jgi:DNA-binding XRE family transcriptional regulator